MKRHSAGRALAMLLLVIGIGVLLLLFTLVWAYGFEGIIGQNAGQGNKPAYTLEPVDRSWVTVLNETNQPIEKLKISYKNKTYSLHSVGSGQHQTVFVDVWPDGDFVLEIELLANDWAMDWKNHLVRPAGMNSLTIRIKKDRVVEILSQPMRAVVPQNPSHENLP